MDLYEVMCFPFLSFVSWCFGDGRKVMGSRLLSFIPDIPLYQWVAWWNSYHNDFVSHIPAQSSPRSRFPGFQVKQGAECTRERKILPPVQVSDRAVRPSRPDSIINRVHRRNSCMSIPAVEGPLSNSGSCIIWRPWRSTDLWLLQSRKKPNLVEHK